MLLLEAGNIKKYYSDRLIVELNHFEIHSGDRIGVVGLNGSGKTTLLDILAGHLESDEGYVKRYCDIGYVRQFQEDGSCPENGITPENSSKPENGITPARLPLPEGDFTSQSWPVQDRDLLLSPRLIQEFDLKEKLQRDGLSGGEHTRLKIVSEFSKDNLLLFADEPTSNLDFKGIGLLKQKLEKMESFLLISHDRDLLDSLCNRILEVKNGNVRLYNGNFSLYKQRCELEKEQMALEYGKYIDAKESLEAAISNRQLRAKKIRKAPKRMGNSEARLQTRKANESQEKLHNSANSLMTRLEKLEVKEKPRELPGIKLDFSLTNPPENKIILSAENLSFSYGAVPVFNAANFKVYNGVKTAIWGENGSGKTTLLNLIYTNEYRSINIVPRARLAYFCQGFENLELEKSVLENVMRDSVQNETVVRTVLARLLLQGDAVYKKVAVLSGGERIKTAFARMFVSGANVLLLDEPTNYLDMQSIEALESVLKEYEGTVLFVSHDKAFVNSVADKLLVLGDCKVKEFDGKLDQYESKEAMQKNSKERASGNTAGIPNELEKTMLQMKLTEIISRLSAPNGDKEALEGEYRRLVALLRQS